MTLGRLLTNLLLTVALEGGALWVFPRDKKLVWYSFLCNLLTNPAANLLMALLVLWQGAGMYLPALVYLELLVVAAEAFVYRLLVGWPWKKAGLCSLGLNGFSCGVGLLLQGTFA